MKKRAVSIILLALLSLSLAFAMGANEGEGKAKVNFTPRLDKSTKGTIYVLGQLANFESLEAVINDFNEVYPEINVQYECLDTYFQNIPLRVLSGENADIVSLTKAYFANFPYLSEEVIPLDDAIPDAVEILGEESVKDSVINDEFVMLPLMRGMDGMVVNETILKDAGLEAPKTYPELLACCEKLKGLGYIPLQGYTVCVPRMLFVHKYLYDLSREEKEELLRAEPEALEKARSIFEEAMMLCEKGYMSLEENAKIKDSYHSTIMKFLEGDVPFLLCSAETFSGMRKRETQSEAFKAHPFEYVFTSAPNEEDGSCSYVYAWWSFCITKRSEQKEIAKEFLRFLSRPEELTKMASIKGLPPATKDVDSALDKMFSFGSTDKFSYDEPTSSYPQVDAVFYDAIATLISTRSVDDAISMLKEGLEKIT